MGIQKIPVIYFPHTSNRHKSFALYGISILIRRDECFSQELVFFTSSRGLCADTYTAVYSRTEQFICPSILAYSVELGGHYNRALDCITITPIYCGRLWSCTRW